MIKKGFATVIVLIIFIVLSIIILIVVQKQHTNIDASTQAKFKATSKIAAESAAQFIINNASATVMLNGTSIPVPDSSTCKPAADISIQLDTGYVVIPQSGFCLIDTKTYSLRVIGYESANKLVKTELSVGFKQE